MPAPPSRPAPPGRRSDSPSSPLAKSSSTPARTATSPRVPSSLNSSATATRRTTRPPSGDQKDLASQLKRETEQRESLLVKLQEKDQTIENLTTETSNLTSSLQHAETRLNELYADQSRSETELAQRIDISEKLRQQIRELEKEKRDLQRRYNEQTSTFDAERQAFYDSDQHLKSRIQSLSQARKRAQEPVLSSEPESETEVEDEQQPDVVPLPTKNKPDLEDDAEPAEMTALKLELSTLSTSYTSMQNTLVLLQSQLVDLKRVNHELQEENESYMILLREKTLSGQFNVMKQVGADSSDGEDEDEDYNASTGDRGSLRSTGRRSTLGRVEEEDIPGSLADELGSSILGDEVGQSSLGDELARSMGSDQLEPPSTTRPSTGRKRTLSSSRSPRGESLADLPITGPGLDLAAELGRAENKDILEGKVVEDRDRSVLNSSQGKKSTRKASSGHTLEPSGSSNEMEALKSEVKSLKDANKALSLYAAKIIDRIVAQEGFEHVLAVDYGSEPNTPATAGPTKPSEPPKSPAAPAKQRPQSVLVGRATSNPGPSTPTSSFMASPPKLGSPPEKPVKAQRRSMSFDWRGFSLFSGKQEEKKPDPNLRPLTLRPGSSSIGNTARKLDTQEDDEDRKERDRLNATMKLMGIQPPPTQSPTIASPVLQPASPSQTPAQTSSAAPSSNANRRFSFFGRSPAPDPAPAAELTHEALEHAEVENQIAALDNHERNLSVELAKGGGSGFTEIQRKPGGRRSRRSQGGSGSGSTVWSMGEED